MKKILSVLMIAFAMTAMVACGEKDNGTDTPGGNDGGEGSVSLTIDEQSLDQGLAAIRWHVALNNLRLSTFAEGGSAYSYGICYVEDGTPQYSDRTDSDNGTNLESANDDSTRLDFTSYCWVYPRKVARLFVYLSDGKFHYSEPFVLDLPANPDPGDLGISTPELWESTETSLTVHAHVTGSVSDYLWQYPNYSCGLIWCPASEGAPTMNSSIYTAGGDDIYYVIEGLTSGTEYNVAAWLKLTPESEPVISDVRTFSPSQSN